MALRSIEAEHKRRADWRARELNAAADLTTFESVPHEEWAEKDDLFEIGSRFARSMLAANPNFRHRGMCVAIYDEVGIAVSVMPLDTLQ
jgi:hypothetical protein